jgi:Uncharacterised protein conserved in bacteria (DUF2336)
VSFPNSSGRGAALGLGDRPGVDVTARLLLARTALYAERTTHTVEEQNQYAQFALRLIARVDEATRATVAAILRDHAAVPAVVLERLNMLHPTVEPRGLAPPAFANGDPLAQQPIPPSVLAIVPEAAAEAPSPARTADPTDAAMAPAPGAATPIPAGLGEAFFAANAAERRRLLLVIQAAPIPDDNAATAAPAGDFDAVERRFAALDTAAMEGRIGEFIREFERLLGVPKTLCERILNDPSGEPMTVAAKAINMPSAVLQRILLLVNPAVSHSVKRVYDLTDLFHELDRAAASTLLSLWRAQAAPDRAETRPEAADRRAPRETTAALRSRFGALAERIGGVTARPAPGNAGRRDLRSR